MHVYLDWIKGRLVNCAIPCISRRGLTDGVLAHVRPPSGRKVAAQPRLRLSRSTPSLHCALKTVVRIRMPSGVGGAAPARRPPIPIIVGSSTGRSVCLVPLKTLSTFTAARLYVSH